MDPIKTIIKGFEKRLAHRKDHPTEKSAEFFYQGIMKYYQRIDEAREERKPLAWIGALVPVEILYAMDIVPFVPELHVAIAASQGNMVGYLDASAGWGLPVELCSIHRTMTGMTIHNDLPTPDLMVNTSWVCDSGLKSFGSLREHYGCPDFMLDLPRFQNEDGIRYYTKELTNLVQFLEESTGHRLNRDRLREAMESSHRANRLFYEVNELRKGVPCPIRARDAFRNFTVYKHLAGTPDAVSYFEALLQEVKARVEAGTGAIPNESHRLYWIYVTPNYALNIFDWMEEEHGAVVVMDMFNAIAKDTCDPSEGIPSLAQKGFQELLARTLGGPIEVCATEAIRIAQEYQVDGAVFLSHIGCKQGGGMIRMIKDALKEKAGVPTLILDGDVIDPSVLPIEQFKSKLEEFFEMIEDNR